MEKDRRGVIRTDPDAFEPDYVPPITLTEGDVMVFQESVTGDVFDRHLGPKKRIQGTMVYPRQPRRVHISVGYNSNRDETRVKAYIAGEFPIHADDFVAVPIGGYGYEIVRREIGPEIKGAKKKKTSRRHHDVEDDVEKRGGDRHYRGHLPKIVEKGDPTHNWRAALFQQDTSGILYRPKRKK